MGTLAGSGAVALENLSTTGARIAQPRLKVGSSILLQIGDLQCFGDVVWSDDHSSGIAFDEAIDQHAVVRIRRESDLTGQDADVREAAREWALGYR